MQFMFAATNSEQHFKIKLKLKAWTFYWKREKLLMSFHDESNFAKFEIKKGLGKASQTEFKINYLPNAHLKFQLST